MVFPGQASQSVGMGKELYENFKIYKETLEEASEAISIDFKKLCFKGPLEDLNLTINTQPAIVATSVGAFKVLESETDLNPTISSGHSVGEYSALVAAGVIGFSDAIKAVRLRGKSMQESVPKGEGGMLALLGPEDQQAKDFCIWVESQDSSFVLEPANYNCPRQLVLSGNRQALEWAKSNLTEYNFNLNPKKVRLIPLKVSAPFHSRLMQPAQEIMSEHLNAIDFNSPKFLVAQNIDAKSSNDPEKIRKNLIQQVSGPVLWSKTIAGFNNINTYIEVGSGTILTGLIKKIDTSEIKIFNTDQLKGLEDFIDFYC